MVEPASQRVRISELAALFLRLGLTAFGGPAAHVALMENEVVRRRRWISHERFLDMLGAANLIPGPSSSELAVFIGYEQAGLLGLVVAGVCFVLPAALITGAIAWAYVRFGSLPRAGALLYGVKPVVIAVVVQALVGLTPKALKGSASLAVLGVAAAVAAALHADALLVLLAAGTIAMVGYLRRARAVDQSLVFVPLGIGLSASTPSVGLVALFGVFLKLGAVVFGSGYVLAGSPGAVVATVGIFLPGFLVVAAIRPLVARARKSPGLGAFLDGVNVASVALMAVVTVELATTVLVDWISVALAALSAALLLRFRLNSTWLIAGGAALGLAVHGF